MPKILEPWVPEPPLATPMVPPGYAYGPESLAT